MQGAVTRPGRMGARAGVPAAVGPGVLQVRRNGTEAAPRRRLGHRSGPFQQPAGHCTRGRRRDALRMERRVLFTGSAMRREAVSSGAHRRSASRLRRASGLIDRSPRSQHFPGVDPSPSCGPTATASVPCSCDSRISPGLPLGRDEGCSASGTSSAGSMPSTS